MNTVAYWTLADAQAHADMRTKQTGRPWTVTSRPVAAGVHTHIHHAEEAA